MKALTLTMAEYQALPGINWSTLKELRQSPLHYQHALKTPRPDTPAMALGRAVHCAVFEPDALPLRYAVYQHSKTQGPGARTRWQAFQEQMEAAGLEILSAEQWEVVTAIRDAVRTDPVASKYLARGKPEQTIQWQDRETGLQCKARLDWTVPPARLFGQRGVYVELKSTRDAGVGRFASRAASLLYHGQVSFYRRGLKTITGEEHDARLIVVESAPPFDVIVYEPDDDWLSCGDVLVDELLSEVATRRASGCWPGAAKGEELTLPLPGWAIDHDWEVTEEE